MKILLTKYTYIKKVRKQISIMREHRTKVPNYNVNRFIVELRKFVKIEYIITIYCRWYTSVYESDFIHKYKNQ